MSVSVQHEAIVALLQERPELAPELLGELLHLDVPAHDAADLAAGDLTQPVPTEYRADVVIRLRRAGVVTHAVIVEVQLRADATKPFTWPYYAAALRARERIPVTLLVITTHAKVARWARQPIETGQPGSAFTPLVLGPLGVPKLTIAEEIERRPDLAVLSALSHAEDLDGPPIATAALQALSRPGDDGLRVYYNLLAAALGQRPSTSTEQHPMVKVDLETIVARGIIERARLDIHIKNLMVVITARGLVPNEEELREIRSAVEEDEVTDWLKKAVTANTVAEILDIGV